MVPWAQMFLAPDRKFHLRQCRNVPNASIDNECLHTVRLQRSRQQVAKVTIGAGRDRPRDQDVARLTHFNRDMEHPVIARWHQHRDGRAGYRGARVDRTHVRSQKSGPSLRLVNRGDSIASQRRSGCRVRARNLAHDDVLVNKCSDSG